MNNLDFIESPQIKKNLPEFGPGDTVRIHYKITEGEKTRIQVFEGTVIYKTKRGNRATFCVRKVSYNIGVERIFPLNSPNINKIEVTRKGKVRQARLYYLRGKQGKAARVKEKTRY